MAVMPSFFARRYVRPLASVGRLERTLSVLILLLAAGVVAAFVRQSLSDREPPLFELADPAPDQGLGLAAADAGPFPPEAAPAYVPDAENPFPPPDIPGWSRPEQVARYTPDNLYQKINGRVGLYLQYHVAGLAFGSYVFANSDDRTLDIFWYDMGSPENALGIYRAEAPPDAEEISIGTHGYTTGGAVFFIKGGHYVQILPATTQPADAEAALAVARRISDSIADEGDGPWALRVFPKEGRRDGSLEYVSEDAFGLSFLKEVFTVSCEVDGAAVTLFVHRAADAAAADALYHRYLAYFREDGRVLWTDPEASRRMTAGEVYGAIDVVFVHGRYLGGAAGVDNMEIGRSAAARFLTTLQTAE